MPKNPSVPMLEKLAVPVLQAGELSSSGKDLIYKAINGGDLKSIKIGKKRLILIESLMDWLRLLEERTQTEMGFPSPLESRRSYPLTHTKTDRGYHLPKTQKTTGARKHR